MTKNILAALVVVMFLSVGGCSSETISTATPTEPPTTASPGPASTPVLTATPLVIDIVDPGKQYTATIETEKGNIVLELFASDVPITVSNFIHLARQGYYDNTTFHRVIPGFMAQGGVPTGTGAGNPGYFIPDEITQHTHVAGALSMANMGVPDTGGGQFFITYTPQHHLDGLHSVFGQLIEGMDVLESLTPRNPADNPDFDGDAVIRITIEEI